MKMQSKTWNRAEEPTLRIERFWPNGRAENFDLDELPSAIEIPNGASTIVSIFDPSIEIRSIDALLVIEEQEAPDFEDFFLANVPEDHAIHDVALELEWEGLDVEVKPGVVLPSPYAVETQGEAAFVVVAIARNPDGDSEEPSKLPLLIRENSEGDYSELLGNATPSGHYAWFSNPVDGITSWEGGSSCAYLGRGIWSTLTWGDLDNTISISRMSDTTDESLAEHLIAWVAEQNLETWLALTAGVATAEPNLFTKADVEELEKSVAQLMGRNITVAFNVAKPIEAKLEEAVEASVNGRTVQEFLSNPDYPLRTQMMTMIRDAAQNSSPGGVLDAANLNDWLLDAENFQL